MLSPQVGPQPLKHWRYPFGAEQLLCLEDELTVCIAAKATTPEGLILVLCADMMGSTDSSSAETTVKLHSHERDFYGLIAGPIATAREVVASCLRELDAGTEPVNFADIIARVRKGIGKYKRQAADAHVQSRLGMSYSEFRRTGKDALPDDLFRETAWEIRNQYSQCELIITGFNGRSPIIVKVSGDSAGEQDNFAVIGSGTVIAEASLFHREHNITHELEQTLYHVYEAKRLAEKAPSVGKKTSLYVVKPGKIIQCATPDSIRVLESYFQGFSPRPVQINSEDASSHLLTIERRRQPEQ